jgi:hypothetical protein
MAILIVWKLLAQLANHRHAADCLRQRGHQACWNVADAKGRENEAVDR